MTYGLDLFSDAPPASMPMTATITTTASALLVLCLSQWHRYGHVLRIVLFVLITGCFATTVSAQQGYTVGSVSTSGAWTYSQCASEARNVQLHTIGMWAPTLAELKQRVEAAAVPSATCSIGGQTWTIQGWVNSDGLGISASVKFYANFPQIRFGMISTTETCPEGQARDPVTGKCEVLPCTAGETDVLNLGVGYAKTTRNVDDWINPQFYTTACNSGCQVSVGAIVAGSCGVGGLIGPPYPGYCDFQTTTTGQECTASDEAATEPLPPIPCPEGMQAGTVNGVGGCYAVSTATKETTVTDNGDGTTTTTETVTGPTGTTTTTTTCNGDGACSSTTTHVGGGGTTSAPGEIGQDYDGSPEGEEEGEGACGKEGLPDCKVKVNEDGTPQEVEGMQAALDGVLQGVQEQFDYLGGMGWVREELPFVWNPSFPSGSCAAVEIHGYQIDICEPLGKARMVWAFVLAFMAGLYIWRQSTEVMKGA